MSRTTEYSFVAKLNYWNLAKYAKETLSVPGNLKRDEYIELFRLHKSGLKDEFNVFLNMINNKRMMSECSKRCVGRPKKHNFLESQIIQLSMPKSTLDPVDVKPVIPIKKMMPNTIEPDHQTLKYEPIITEVYPSSSSQNIVFKPPIAKSTCQRLRSVLLSTDRSRFNNLILKDEKYGYYNQTKWKNNSSLKNSSVLPSIPVNVTHAKPSIPVNGFLLPGLQSFPDIPQLADVDVNASFDLDNSNNYNMNNTINEIKGPNTGNTLRNQSAIEKELPGFDQLLTKMIQTDNETNGTQQNCETLNLFDDGSLLGLQDTLVENNILQSYIDTNNIQFMQLPDSISEVIQTLQFYESSSVDESLPSKNTEQDKQFNLGGINQTVAEVAFMLPCPITGCLWHSHSAALYVHIFTCHQQMLYYGNSITHVFKYDDVRNSHYSTHLQFVQSTIYIITVTYVRFTYIATIQHVSSCGDYTKVFPATAVLTLGFIHNSNGKEQSWTGQVQPYCVPLDVLHTDGKCLFIDPIDCKKSKYIIVNVKITVPLAFQTNEFINL